MTGPHAFRAAPAVSGHLARCRWEPVRWTHGRMLAMATAAVGLLVVPSCSVRGGASDAPASTTTTTEALDLGAPGATGTVALGAFDAGQVTDVFLHEGLVVVVTHTALTALDIETGSLRWQTPHCERAHAAHRFASRVGHRLLVTCDREFRMLDLDRGRFEWTRPLDSGSYIRLGEAGLVSRYGATVEIYDPADGRRRYSSELDDDLQGPSIAVDAERIYLGGHHAITAVDADGREQWTAAVQALSMGSDGEVLVVQAPDQRLWILDAVTGEPLAQETVGSLEDEGMAVIDFAGDLVLLGRLSDAPQLYVVVDRWSGEVVWEGNSDELGEFEAVGAGRLVVTGGSCRVLGLDDGEEVARCPAATVASTVHDDRLAAVVADDEGTRVEVQRIGR